VLVTSRTVLQLYGEHDFPVPPLALPDRRSAPTAKHITQFESSSLFVQRAQAARPEFELTDENAPYVAEICQRVDGLPLAIELAAARVRALPPRTMLQRMERRLPLLTSGARDLPERQQTLQAAIAWSYELLGEAERVLFRRLAVFRGCTLEGAEAVCQGQEPGPGTTSVALPLIEISVLDGLESLVQKSLLLQQGTPDGGPWYVMLETIREFALDRLEESGEGPAVVRRHVLITMNYLESLEREIASGLDSDGQLNSAEREHENLREALEACLRGGYAEPAYRLVICCIWMWVLRGHVTEGRWRLTSVLQRFPLREPGGRRAVLRAKALCGAGSAASIQGDFSAARDHFSEALQLGRQLDDGPTIVGALQGLANAASLEGQPGQALPYLEDSLTIARELDDQHLQVDALAALGNLLLELGDLSRARSCLEESLDRFQHALDEQEQLRVVAYVKRALARVAFREGRHDEAQRLATESLNLCQEFGFLFGTAQALSDLAAFAVETGDYAEARARLKESGSYLVELEDMAGVAQALELFAMLAAAQGRSAAALRLADLAGLMRTSTGMPLPPSGKVALERALTAARHQADPGDGRDLPSLGTLPSLEDAMHEALAITEPDDHESVRMSGATSSPLSPREQDVAGLIADGYTNRQIAERLVIGEGTVATHVVHILNKLGFSSRAQVAAWLARRQN
jgi:predicted ATPase/DNA-binding CsgD family transcriptional regulator